MASFSVILHSIPAADYLLHAISLNEEQLGPTWPHGGSACDCFSLYPAQTPYPGPNTQRATLISGEAACAGLLSHLSWEDSYLLRSTAFGAVDCKRRNFRLENCDQPCLHGICSGCGNTLPDFLKALQMVRLRMDWISGSRGRRGNVGSVSETALSAKAEGLT